ncbi:YniB family protein [Enterobacter asburiae]|uniref:YniB family protein n=1 Tax=Enterobacter asburiae TaxID=61645 RepID=UPI003855AED5
MTYHEAKMNLKIYYLAGIILFSASALAMIMMLLKGMYFLSITESNNPFPYKINTLIGNFFSFIFYQPYFPKFLWATTPIINVRDLFSVENTPLLFMYILLFLSTFFISAASELSSRTKKVKQRIEEEIMAASLRGESTTVFKKRIER